MACVHGLLHDKAHKDAICACSNISADNAVASLYIAIFDSYVLNKPELGHLIDVESNLYPVRTMMTSK